MKKQWKSNKAATEKKNADSITTDKGPNKVLADNPETNAASTDPVRHSGGQEARRRSRQQEEQPEVLSLSLN